MKLHVVILLAVAIFCGSVAKAQSGADSVRSLQYVPDELKADQNIKRIPRMIAIKTNIIPWGASIMNIGVEFGINRHISVSIPAYYCPWFIAEKHALRVAAVQPECRWWPATPGKGHFAAIHASLAWYNMKWGDYRYQDQRRPLIGAGLSYGYAFRFNSNWALELSAGIGFLSLRYDRFFNTPNGQLCDTRQTAYLGPDHIAVSLVYNLGH